ncbi:MAG TPA: SUMF1/EgtB/PvdO family nonheme iron enzyme [Gammaproteobacteria bacterium]|nr:SUMF1/EgtB/PvdO family nonheme iron enzyme [Gammaproteobacteria bacterium]
MSETITLRQLSRDYAQGHLTLAQYREQRARLLDGLYSGTTSLMPYRPSPTPPVDLGEKSSTTLQGIKLSPLPIPSESSRRSLWLVAAAIAVIAVGAGIYFLYGGQPTAPIAENPPPAPESPPPEAASPPTATPPAPSAAPSSPLVEDFVHKADWKKESLDRFLADWAALSESERGNLRQSPPYRDLVDGTYSEIIKEEALLGLGDDKEVLNREDVLLHFADQMEFNGERFKEAAEKLAKLRAAQTAGTPAPAAPAATPVTPPPAPAPAAPVQVAKNAPATPPPPAAPAESKPEIPPEAATPTAAAASTAATAVAPAATAPAGAPKKETAAEKTPPETEKAAATAAAVTAATAVAAAATSKKETAAEKTPPEAEKASSVETEAETAAKQEPAEAAAPEAKTTAKQKRTLECYADLAKERKPFCRDGMNDGGVGPILAVLPAGEFTMGGGAPHAEPAHKVTIPRNLAVSLYEVSSGEFEAFCKATSRSCPPQPWQGADFPVVNVSWADATAYAEWLSKATGHSYRLPTEAEWEYAARAGTTSRYPFGDELLPTHARFSYQGPVDSPLPRSDHTVNRNNFKLYHMVGNVREWVQDGWHDNYQGAPTDGKAWEGSGHTVRGGCYRDRAESLTSASRESGPAQGDDCTGFRVVEDIPAQSRQETRPVAKRGPAWAKAQGQNQYTLQLFAVQSIKQVEKLMTRFPKLELMIVPTEDPELPFRVYYGLFDNKELAHSAWAQLPRALIKDNPRPFIQSFAQIQRSVAGR